MNSLVCTKFNKHLELLQNLSCKINSWKKIRPEKEMQVSTHNLKTSIIRNKLRNLIYMHETFSRISLDAPYLKISITHNCVDHLGAPRLLTNYRFDYQDNCLCSFLYKCTKQGCNSAKCKIRFHYCTFFANDLK